MKNREKELFFIRTCPECGQEYELPISECLVCEQSLEGLEIIPQTRIAQDWISVDEIWTGIEDFHLARVAQLTDEEIAKLEKEEE